MKLFRTSPCPINLSIKPWDLYTGNFVVFMKNKSQYCDFPGSIPILALKITHSGKSYRLGMLQQLIISEGVTRNMDSGDKKAREQFLALVVSSYIILDT